MMYGCVEAPQKKQQQNIQIPGVILHFPQSLSMIHQSEKMLLAWQQGLQQSYSTICTTFSHLNFFNF